MSAAACASLQNDDDAPPRPQVESRAQIAWLDEEGTIRVISKPNVDLTLEDAQEIIRKLSALCAGRRRPALIDLTHAKSISRDARKYFAGPETAKVESAAALLINSPLGRAIGNFFIGINKGATPVCLFTAEAEALDWLRSCKL